MRRYETIMNMKNIKGVRECLVLRKRFAMDALFELEYRVQSRGDGRKRGRENKS